MPRSTLGWGGATGEEGESNGNGRHRHVSFDDEKASLLHLGAGSNINSKKGVGAEARDVDDSTRMTYGGTFAPVGSAPLTAEEQQHHHHHTRKPSISIVDGYNSPVRRGGPRNTMEVEEETTAMISVSGLSGSGSVSCGIFHHHENGAHGHNHDHCVIARREVEQVERLSSKVRFAVHASICANVFLSAVSAYAAIRSGSLAVLASLVDTLLDLISQVVLSVAEHRMRKPSDEHYPAGRSRIEPVGVIIVSVIMGVAALELLRASIGTMVMALAYGKLPHLGK